jgi:predicted glycosyl hydrolase (DUF1957 family)
VVLNNFQRWALCLPVPALGLPCLTGKEEYELERRAFEISFDLTPGTDDDLAQCLCELGSLNYLERQEKL